MRPCGGEIGLTKPVKRGAVKPADGRVGAQVHREFAQFTMVLAWTSEFEFYNKV